jgi:putative transposase
MTNHVHLLLSPEHPEDASRLMQSLGRRYVRYINTKYGRSGTLWEGRFRACGVHAEDYLLVCMRYIELNPLRVALVTSPEPYRWASFCRNALGKEDSQLAEHALYTALGDTPTKRQAAYLELFREQLDQTIIADIRTATGSGHLLATVTVRKQVEARAGQLLGPATRGRPPRSRAKSESGKS